MIKPGTSRLLAASLVALAVLLGVFLVGGDVSAAPGDHVAAADFDLALANRNPTGITWDGTYFRVVDSTDRRVYAYDSSGSYVSSQDFNLAAANTVGFGIAWDGTYFRVVDNNDTVYAYDSSGSYVSSQDFNLAPANTSQRGITWDGTYLRVVDTGEDKVYAYDSSGSYVSSQDFDLAAANTVPSGIAWDGTYFRVVDNNDTVYAYNSSGSYVSNQDFNLATDNDLGIGITLDDTYVRVVDGTDSKVYTYEGSNLSPTADAGSDQSVAGGAAVTLDGSGSSDSDGTIASYAWTQTAGDTVTLTGATTSTPSFTAPTEALAQTLTFNLEVTDDDGATDTATVDVSVARVQLSVFDDQGLDMDLLALLEASGDTTWYADSDRGGTDTPIEGELGMGSGETVVSRIRHVTGDNLAINNNDNPAELTLSSYFGSGGAGNGLTIYLQSNAGLASFPVSGNISGTPGGGFINFDPPAAFVTIMDSIDTGDWFIFGLGSANDAPTADAGSNQSVNAGVTVILDGSGSSDSDGNIASYSWTQTAGTSVTLSNAGTASPTFEAPSNHLAPVTLTFELEVTDDDGATDTGTVDVTVARPTEGAYAACSSSNSPAIDLGEVDVEGGTVLTRTGQLSGTIADALCVDGDSRASAYFQFTIASGEDGAVKIEAPQGTSAMRPELILRSGTAYTGAVHFQDVRSDVEDALAAGLVDDGTYTLQLRATEELFDELDGSGGAYSLTVTRLQPAVTTLTAAQTSLMAVWDVGAAVYSDTDNTVELPIKVDYQVDGAATWTPAETDISPSSGSRNVEVDVTGLTLGQTYVVRAGYTNASHYEESDPILTRAPILLSGAPYGVEGTVNLLDEMARRWEIRVSWESPAIEVDANSDWHYGSRLDEGVTVLNEAGDERVQETRFTYTLEGTEGAAIEIEVNNSIICTDNGQPSCMVTYNSREYEIPAGETWATPWSVPGLVQIPGSPAEADSGVTDRDPDDAIVQLLDAVLGVAGVPDGQRPSRALSVVLCAVLGLVGGFGAALRTGGMKLVPVVLGAGVFFSIFGGLGPELFGVPGALVVVVVGVTIAIGALAVAKRFAL